MTRLEFIRGAVSSAAVAAVPTSVAAPPFEDLDPDARYETLWRVYVQENGMVVPRDDASPVGPAYRGHTLIWYLLDSRQFLDPDHATRRELVRPLAVRKVGSKPWTYIDAEWLREFYRRHA